MPHIFVYGTLCRGQCRQSCWPREPVSITRAFVRGRLFDLGPYPAMLPGDDWVRGERWTLREADMAETLRVLDAIEGFGQGGDADLYRRCEVEIFASVGADASPTSHGVTYFLVPERLPKWARRIVPSSRGGVGADSASEACCVYWPVGDPTPEELSLLPDPFDPTT